MVRDTSANDYEARLLKAIETTGWFCTAVAGESPSQSFAYTIGLHHSFNHPELIVFGLTPQRAHTIISAIADRASERSFPRDEQTGVAKDNAESWMFLPVPKCRYEEFVLSGLWFYEDHDFPLMHLIWPDESSAFPISKGACLETIMSQPILWPKTELDRH